MNMLVNHPNQMPKRIETRRLVLRALKPSDAPEIATALNNLNISKWLGMVPFPYCQKDAEFFINLVKESNEPNYCIRKDNEFCGIIGLSESNFIGYWIAESFWKQGICSEAAIAVVDAFFASTGDVVMTSSYVEGNVGSAQILKKIGFVDVGSVSINVKALGKDLAGRSLQLTKRDWQANRALHVC